MTKKKTPAAAEPAGRRQPISADEAAMLHAEYGENAPPRMHVCLFRNGWVDVLQLTAGDIDLEDIAHGLSLTNHWNGATEQAVSVAWHSLVVSALASENYPAAALHGLMHDAAEACTGDWTRPYKLHLGPMLTGIAERIEDACLKAAGVREPATTRKAVKEADESALLLEHSSQWGHGTATEDRGRGTRSQGTQSRTADQPRERRQPVHTGGPGREGIRGRSPVADAGERADAPPVRGTT